MRTCSILDDLINTVKASDGQKITRLDLIGGEVDEVGRPFFPSETSACLNEIDVQLLLVLGRLSTEEGYFGVSSQSAHKDLYRLEHIRNPMLERVTEPEDMDTPSDHIVILNRIHVLPSELEVITEGEAMDVYFGSSAKNIRLCAKLPSPADCSYLHGDSVDVIELLVGEVDDNLVETIILSSF